PATALGATPRPVRGLPGPDPRRCGAVAAEGPAGGLSQGGGHRAVARAAGGARPPEVGGHPRPRRRARRAGPAAPPPLPGDPAPGLAVTRSRPAKPKYRTRAIAEASATDQRTGAGKCGVMNASMSPARTSITADPTSSANAPPAARRNASDRE